MPDRRPKSIASVMEELRGYIDAVEAFQTAVAAHFGLERRDFKWLAALAEAEDGLPLAELERLVSPPGGAVADTLEDLRAAGHVTVTEDVVRLQPDARSVLTEALKPIEAAQFGLHRYGAEELGIVRNFMRVGRTFYERQLQRFLSARGSPSP